CRQIRLHPPAAAPMDQALIETHDNKRVASPMNTTTSIPESAPGSHWPCYKARSEPIGSSADDTPSPCTCPAPFPKRVSSAPQTIRTRKPIHQNHTGCPRQFERSEKPRIAEASNRQEIPKVNPTMRSRGTAPRLPRRKTAPLQAARNSIAAPTRRRLPVPATLPNATPPSRVTHASQSSVEASLLAARSHPALFPRM